MGRPRSEVFQIRVRSLRKHRELSFVTAFSSAQEIRKDAPGRVTAVSYDGLKFALDCGIDVWDYAETYALQNLIADVGTPAQKQRLREEILAGRWATEIMLAEKVSAPKVDSST